MSTVADIDVKIDEKIKDIFKEPNRYNVIFLNDNSTPMEWVIDLLMRIFKHTQSSAENLTMEIHTNGSAIVGTYSYEIAEQKTIEATQASREHGFSLQIKLEAE
jgi:ATP-dependent Clp protease adaptor protein ClpS